MMGWLYGAMGAWPDVKDSEARDSSTHNGASEHLTMTIIRSECSSSCSSCTPVTLYLSQ
jgi:hypothetical protein